MRKAWIPLAAALAVLAIAPAADASTASKIKALQKAVKQLQSVNRTQASQIASLKSQNATQAGQIASLQSHDTTLDGQVDTIAGGTVLLLAFQLCMPNLSGLDGSVTSYLSNGTNLTQYFFSGDSTGPEPVGGVIPCLNNAVNTAAAARTTKGAAVSRFGFDGVRAKTDALVAATKVATAKAATARR